MTISIIIVSYNQSAYIKQAIESALSQSLDSDLDLEVIVVDNDSTDESAEIIKSYGSAITYIQTGNNLGPSASRNRGIDAARGEWLAFLDGDDYWDSGFLQCLLNSSESADLVIGPWQVVNADGSIRHGIEPICPEPELIEAFCRSPFAHLLSHNYFPLHAALVRSSRIWAAGGFNPDLWQHEDHDLWLRLAMDNAIFKGMGRVAPMANYRRPSGVVSNGSDLEKMERAMRKVIDQAINTPSAAVNFPEVVSIMKNIRVLTSDCQSPRLADLTELHPDAANSSNLYAVLNQVIAGTSDPIAVRVKLGISKRGFIPLPCWRLLVRFGHWAEHKLRQFKGCIKSLLIKILGERGFDRLRGGTSSK